MSNSFKFEIVSLQLFSGDLCGDRQLTYFVFVLNVVWFLNVISYHFPSKSFTWHWILYCNLKRVMWMQRENLLF